MALLLKDSLSDFGWFREVGNGRRQDENFEVRQLCIR